MTNSPGQASARPGFSFAVKDWTASPLFRFDYSLDPLAIANETHCILKLDLFHVLTGVVADQDVVSEIYPPVRLDAGARHFLAFVYRVLLSS